MITAVVLLLSLKFSYAISSWIGCISHHEVIEIKKYKGELHEGSKLSLNLSINLGESLTPIILDSSKGLCDHNESLLATWDELNEIVVKANKGQPGCYVLYDDGSKPWRVSVVSTNSGIPALLCPPIKCSGAPTMVLGGFTMHRLTGEKMNPMQDTIEKIDAIECYPGFKILDTCMGLGYTAIEAGKRVSAGGSSSGEVITFEIDDASVEVASYNPWSCRLFDGTLPITIQRGDVCKLIETFPDHYFNGIIHDPPARALCNTDLYSQPFYDQLFRVLRPGGTIFHYIGNPTSKESGTLFKGVLSRLKAAGFHIPVDYIRAFGVRAEVPRITTASNGMAAGRNFVRLTSSVPSSTRSTISANSTTSLATSVTIPATSTTIPATSKTSTSRVFKRTIRRPNMK